MDVTPNSTPAVLRPAPMAPSRRPHRAAASSLRTAATVAALVFGPPAALFCLYYAAADKPVADTQGRWPSAAAGAMQLAAETNQSIAKRLLAEADCLDNLEKAAGKRQQAYEHFCTAGRLHVDLARQHFTSRRFSDHLWAAAMNFIAGRDHVRAVRALETYLKYEPSRRHAQALFALGRSLLTLGHVEQSARAFGHCIALYPRHPIVHQARIWASKAHRELADFEPACRLLEANLADDAITPASIEWRESLFALGDLYYIEGEYEQAREKLAEAVRRFPGSPASIAARYRLAQCGRHLVEQAKPAGERSVQPTLLSEEKSNGRRESLLAQSLQYAIEAYSMLSAAGSEGGQAEWEQAMLRNLALLRCDLLAALGNYQQAARLASDLAPQYRGTPTELELAARRIVLLKRLGKHDSARQTLQQAEQAAASLASAPWPASSTFTRRQWADLLAHYSKWQAPR